MPIYKLFNKNVFNLNNEILLFNFDAETSLLIILTLPPNNGYGNSDKNIFNMLVLTK